MHKPCIWPSSPQVLCSSVVRASDRCMEGHTGGRLIPVGDSDFSWSCARDMLITVFLISSMSLKFTIFVYLSKEIPYY